MKFEAEFEIKDFRNVLNHLVYLCITECVKEKGIKLCGEFISILIPSCCEQIIKAMVALNQSEEELSALLEDVTDLLKEYLKEGIHLSQQIKAAAPSKISKKQ